MNLRRLFAVAAAALCISLLVALAVVPASAQAGTRGDGLAALRAAPEASAVDRVYLRAQADQHGTVNVIVGLVVNLPGRMPFADMDDGAQRAVISQMQDAVLAQIGQTRSTPEVKRYVTFPMMALRATPEELDVLLESTLVSFIQENRWREPSLIESTAIIGMQGGSGAWAQGADGSGTNVVVIDSGIQKSHQFLTGKVVREACWGTTGVFTGFTATTFCPGNVSFTDVPGSGEPCNVAYGGECNHGTHVAGIIAGKSSPPSDTFNGVAKEASLVSLQVFSRIQDDTNPATPAVCRRDGYESDVCILAADGDIIAAMDFARLLHNPDTFPIAAVNMSLGNESYPSQASCDASLPAYVVAVAGLNSIGVPVVASSGNQGSTISMNAPACITGVISVGASTDFDQIATFTNSASFLTFVAPGVNINSADPGPPPAYFPRSGTSQAAPHVSGAIAALLSLRPTAGITQIIDALKNSAVNISDIGGTFKRIDVDGAIGELDVPDTPKLRLPDDGAAFAETPITFKFSTGAFTDRATLEIYDGNTRVVKENVNDPDNCPQDPDFGNKVVCAVNVTYAFEDDTTYTWFVIAKNLDNGSQSQSVTRSFEFDTPGRATLLAPADKVTINTQAELAVLQWGEVNLATSYRVTLFDTDDGAVIVNATLAEGAVCAAQVCTYNVQAFEQSQLLDDKKYKWYVVSIDGDDTSQSKKFKIFTEFPAAPLLTYPDDGGTFNALNDIELRWTEVATAEEYRLRIWKNSNNNKIIDVTYTVPGRSIGCAAGTCTWTPEPVDLTLLQNQTDYRWTVRAENSLGKSESLPRIFRIQSPAPPALIDPANGLEINDANVTFEWSTVSDADSYKLIVKDTKNGEKVVKATVFGTTFAQPAGVFKNDRVYEWFVKSQNALGKAKSVKFAFDTEFPRKPNLQSPADNTKLNDPSELTTLVWRSGNTTEALTYKVVVKRIDNGDKIFKEFVTLGVDTTCDVDICTFTVPQSLRDALKDGKNYKWHVKAETPSGTQKSSQKFIFKARFS
ncbi:MAG: S8 family serine peptidase [Chloroflexi bacterium]|nr:S8 family serine peptidase [Chloroflexota bacterium]